MPSSVQVVPAALLASAGQALLTPVQVSARSQSPAAARQTVVAGRNVQLAEQQGPPSHCSPGSTIPLPQPQVLPFPPQTPHRSSVLPLFGRWSQPHVACVTGTHRSMALQPRPSGMCVLPLIPR